MGRLFLELSRLMAKNRDAAAYHIRETDDE